MMLTSIPSILDERQGSYCHFTFVLITGGGGGGGERFVNFYYEHSRVLLFHIHLNVVGFGYSQFNNLVSYHKVYTQISPFLFLFCDPFYISFCSTLIMNDRGLLFCLQRTFQVSLSVNKVN